MNGTNVRPKLRLGGVNGNAFVLLAKAKRVAIAHRMDWQSIETEAKSGDYDHLLQTLVKYFDVT